VRPKICLKSWNKENLKLWLKKKNSVKFFKICELKNWLKMQFFPEIAKNEAKIPKYSYSTTCLVFLRAIDRCQVFSTRHSMGSHRFLFKKMLFWLKKIFFI
jgi:hypothetical protein